MRRDLVHPNSSTLSLEIEHVDEARPPCIGDRSREVMVLDHAANVEVFNRNDGVAVNVALCRLVSMVLALAGDLEVTLRNLACHLLAPLRALLTPRHLALCSPELLLGVAIAARVLDHLAFGVCKKDLE